MKIGNGSYYTIYDGSKNISNYNSEDAKDLTDDITFDCSKNSKKTIAEKRCSSEKDEYTDGTFTYKKGKKYYNSVWNNSDNNNAWGVSLNEKVVANIEEVKETPCTYINDEPVAYMSWMFYNAKKLKKVDMSTWNTSNVVDMSYMFSYAGYDAETLEIKGFDKIDISNVINMQYMFKQIAFNSKNLYLEGISDLDTSSVTNMSYMFSNFTFSNIENIDLDFSEWDTGNVTNMSGMFSYFSLRSNTDLVLKSIEGWNVEKVKDMSRMFYHSYGMSKSLELDLSNWKTYALEKMSYIFTGVCTHDKKTSCDIFNLNLSNWDTSKVKDLSYCFESTGWYAKEYTLNLSGWDTSNVNTISHMFSGAASQETENTQIIGINTSYYTNGINKKSYLAWDTKNVVYMDSAFYFFCGRNQDSCKLDISNWNTNNVTTIEDMFWDAGGYSINGITFGGIAKKQVTIGDITYEAWNTGKVGNMFRTLYGAKFSSKENMDLSTWNVDNVINHTDFGSGYSVAKLPIWND